eukprot:gene5269-7321_t
MYVWRGKNRRDHNEFKPYDSALVVAETVKGSQRDRSSLLDEQQRVIGETNHVNYFRVKTELLIKEYLKTDHGMKEISALMSERLKFDVRNQKIISDSTNNEKANIRLKEAVKDIFNKFIVKDEDFEIMDSNGLSELLKFLNISLSEKKFDKLYFQLTNNDSKNVAIMDNNLAQENKDKLDDQEETIPDGFIIFESFFEYFLNDIKKQSKGSESGWFGLFIPFVRLNKHNKSKPSIEDAINDADDVNAKENLSLSYHIQHKIQEAEAIRILTMHAVRRAEREARMEYRISHPPYLTCDHCGESFADYSQLNRHANDKEYHRELLNQQLIEEEDMICVNTVFKGDHGRRFAANRLLFSKELDTNSTRVDAARFAPFRPRLTDITGKREKQLRMDMAVQGFDPTIGLRPAHRTKGLIRQHHAAARLAAANDSVLNSITMKAGLKEVVSDLVRCKDEFIDTVSTYDHDNNDDLESLNSDRSLEVPPYGIINSYQREAVQANIKRSKHSIIAKVKFEWNNFAKGKVQIIGEFNGWKPEEVLPDPETGKFSIMKQLGPGRYKYRFIIDGKERVDEVASQVEDIIPPSESNPNPMPIRSNIILITNTQKNNDHNNTNNNNNSKDGKICHVKQSDRNNLIERLSSINLRNMALCDDGAWVLSSFIQRNDFITCVDLSFNSISDDGMQAFGSSLSKLINLKDLKLNGNGFGFDSTRYLTNNLKSNTTLTNLELSDNCWIGNDGLDCLRTALTYNRMLTVISLSNNLFQTIGMNHMQRTMILNASLINLNLSNCNLKSNGVKLIGEFLFSNDTLSILNLNNVNILDNNTVGIHSLCTSLEYNSSLRSLSLRNNGLKDAHGIDFAKSLFKNKGLTDLDLIGNHLHKDVLMVYNDQVPLKGLDGFPPISISLEKNKDYLRVLLAEYDQFISKRAAESDDVKYGQWTRKRRWKKKIDVNAAKLTEKIKVAEESERMRMEKEHLINKLKDYRALMTRYIHEQPCKKYMDAVTKAVHNYIQDLGKIEFDKSYQNRLKARKLKIAISAKKANIRSLAMAQTSGLLSPTNPRDIQSPLFSPKNSTSRVNTNNTDNNSIIRAFSVLPSINSEQKSDITRTLPSPFISEKQKQNNGTIQNMISFPPIISNMLSTNNINNNNNNDNNNNNNNNDDNSNTLEEDLFMHAHVSVMNALFMRLSEGAGAHSMMLHPEKVETLFQLLCISLPPGECQTIVDETIVKPQYQIGMNKLSSYILANASRLCKHNKWDRMRLLADLTFRSPVFEAQTIVLDSLIHMKMLEERAKYRLDPHNKPLHLCDYCNERFASFRLLDKHTRKGYNSYEHRHFRLREFIHYNQSLFLSKIKWSVSGVFMPSYFELLPSAQLPKNYIPQIMDKIGKEGRPMAVVEENRTIRVIDIFGDYLHVCFKGDLGWVRYRHNNRYFLRPACSSVPGFDWNSLHIQEESSYFRMNDDICVDNSIELKVHYLPLINSEVCGYVKKNDVVECFAVVGEWLQIRYHDEEAVWVRWRKSGNNSNNLSSNNNINNINNNDGNAGEANSVVLPPAKPAFSKRGKKLAPAPVQVNAMADYEDKKEVARTIREIKKIIYDNQDNSKGGGSEKNKKMDKTKAPQSQPIEFIDFDKYDYQYTKKIADEYKRLRGIEKYYKNQSVDDFMILLPTNIHDSLHTFVKNFRWKSPFSVSPKDLIFMIMKEGYFDVKINEKEALEMSTLKFEHQINSEQGVGCLTEETEEIYLGS